MTGRQYATDLAALLAVADANDLPDPLTIEWCWGRTTHLQVQTYSDDGVRAWISVFARGWTSKEHMMDGAALRCYTTGHLDDDARTPLVLAYVRFEVSASTWALAQSAGLAYEEAETWLAEFPTLTAEQQHTYRAEMVAMGADPELIPEPPCGSCGRLYDPVREGADCWCGDCARVDA